MLVKVVKGQFTKRMFYNFQYISSIFLRVISREKCNKQPSATLDQLCLFYILCRINHHLAFSFPYPSTVPASPENVTLTTTSSPLRLTWTIDPPDGLVSNYTIYVTRLERGNTVVNYTSTNTQLLQFDIPNLDPYELVEVSVSASNSAGEGPSSTGVRGRTREERKLRNASCCTQVGAYVSILLYIMADFRVQPQV